MTGFNEFIKLISGSPLLLLIVEIIMALVFAFGIYKKFKKQIISQHERQEQMNKDVKEALKGVRMCPQYRQQSIQIQQQLTTALDNITTRLDKIEDERKERERIKLGNLLLQSYNMYADKNKNPLLAWTEMEANAFWELFSQYEKNGGNGHMHSVVQPAMQALRIIKMDDPQQLYELMQSRKI